MILFVVPVNRKTGLVNDRYMPSSVNTQVCFSANNAPAEAANNRMTGCMERCIT